MAKRNKRTIETDLFGHFVVENPINSKKKGDKNERIAAKWLTEWTGTPFTRVPSSGGLRWKNASNVCGDLVCEDESFVFPFAVETKHLKSLVMPKYLRSNSKVFSIYDQAKLDADRAGKHPMMLLRQNGMPSGEFMVFFNKELQELLPIYDCCGHNRKGVCLYGYKSSRLIEVEFAKLREYF